MRGKSARVATIGLLVLLLTVATAVPVLAFDSRTGDLVTIGTDEDVQGDLYVGARSITVSGTVTGALFAGGQTLNIGGVVEEGATVGGQSITFTGVVGRGVRVGGNTIDVTGDIGGDMVAGCNTLTLAEGARIGEDLVFGAGQVYVVGDVEGDIKGVAETLVIAGHVGGDVDVQIGTLEIKPGAVIDGNVKYTATEEAAIPAGTVSGSVAYTERVNKEDARQARQGIEAAGPFFFLAGITWKIIGYLMLLVTGILLILILPKGMAATSNAIRRKTGASAGWGALVLFLTPLAAIVACITVVGLPVGLITLVGWGILLYVSQIPVALLIGHLVLGHTKPLEGKGFMIGSLALGLLLLTLVRAIPFVGFFVGLAVALFGMGGVVVTKGRYWTALNMVEDD
ncbi:MAG: polymer-forming cytoskeletal protein [Dehalococcoidia bacterium]|nr:polymer-forming cytoskeletal protein [Dehalococcoidia bacterium]